MASYWLLVGGGSWRQTSRPIRRVTRLTALRIRLRISPPTELSRNLTPREGGWLTAKFHLRFKQSNLGESRKEEEDR